MSDSNSSDRNVDEEVCRIVEQSKELQESAASLISKNSQEEASLRQRALALDSNVKRLRLLISSSVKKGNLDPKDAEKVLFVFVFIFIIFDLIIIMNDLISVYILFCL